MPYPLPLPTVPHSHNTPQILLKLKDTKAMDARHVALLESAYLTCKPPASRGVKRKARPLMHEYIRYLIYQVLDPDTVELVVIKLRRLEWPNY